MCIGLFLLLAQNQLQSLDEATRIPPDGNPLPIWEQLVANQDRYLASPDKPLFLQYKAAIDSFLGLTSEALASFDQFAGLPPKRRDLGSLKGWRLVGAVEAITRVASNRQVIMIGEAHHAPQTRLLTTELLEPLWRKGFRYLAIEDLNERLAKDPQPSYPRIGDGYYLDEPIFGNLVRTAIKLGYKLVPYDDGTRSKLYSTDFAAQINRREELEAKHLRDRIFAKDPHARVLVHVGFAHNLKSESSLGSSTIVTMARRFKTMTGINPFCVDGYTLMEHPDPAHEDPVYRKYHTRVQKISFLISTDGRFFSEDDGLDAFALLPRVKTVGGRAGWLRTDLHRHTVQVPHPNLVPRP